MQQPISIFALFGGCRSMAKTCREAVSNVYAWQREGRIPATKQPNVLELGIALGLPVTPELVVYPSGIIPEVVAKTLAAHRPRVSRRPTLKVVADAGEVANAPAGRYGNSRSVLATSEQTGAAA